MDSEFRNCKMYRLLYLPTTYFPIILDPSGGLAGNDSFDFNY